MKPDSQQLFDDTKCIMCSRKLTETSDPTDTTFDGYCDQDCVNGKTGINSVTQLATIYGFDGEVRDAGKYLKKRLFKETDCGVCFSVHNDMTGVSVSGYVEGVDCECPEHELIFPFHIDDFTAAVKACDDEAEEMLQQWESQENEI